MFKDRGTKGANSLTQVLERMVVLGASTEECALVCGTVEAFLRWVERRGRVADRVAGVAWLGEIRDRLELERYQAVKAGLTTGFI